MKYLKLIPLCLILVSYASIGQITTMSCEKYLKKVDIEKTCTQKLFHWKRDNSLLDGIFKYKYKKGYYSIAQYSEGILNKSTIFHGKKKIATNIYNAPSNTITTVYENYDLLLLPFDKDYDSVSYYYDKNFLQQIIYYKKGEKLITTINYQAGKIEVKSILDDFFYDPIQFADMNTECPYELLMIDPETGNLFEQIEIEIETPSRQYTENLRLENDLYLPN